MGEPMLSDSLATLAVTVNRDGTPSYRICVHCGDEIDANEAHELKDNLGRLLAIIDHIDGQSAAGAGL